MDWGVAAMAVGTLGFLAMYTLVAVWAERKVSAFIQDRIGPKEVGPNGSLQTLADILKLLLKESICPLRANRLLFGLAPMIVFGAVFAGLAVVPIAPGYAGAELEVSVLYVMAMVSIDVIGILMAGWASNNKYALMGSVRGVAQIVSYEVPAALAILSAVLMFGSLDLMEIAARQGIYSPEPARLLGIWEVRHLGGITSWAVIRYPHLLVAFVVYFITGLAEANRAPFDTPEAESELVAGFHTEYSGYRFAVLMLAEYGVMLIVALLAAVLFLGGWNTPLPNLTSLPAGANPVEMSTAELFANLQFAYLTSGTPGTWTGLMWGLGWTLLKAFGLVFVMMWVRWTFPRLRADHLMRLCWKYLVPIALLLVLVSAVGRLAEVAIAN